MLLSFARDLAEPALVAAIFAIGAYANRRKPKQRLIDEKHNILHCQKKIPTSPSVDDDDYDWGVATTTRRKQRWVNPISRLLQTYPFALEFWYWNWIYWSYQLLRMASARLVLGDVQAHRRAYHHALQILSLETTLGLDVEQALQRSLLRNHPTLLSVLAFIYTSHVPLVVLALAYFYTYLPHPLYRRFRRTLASSQAFALLISTLRRTMPPRLLPSSDALFADILGAPDGPVLSPWNLHRHLPTVASMPCLHFGIALLAATCAGRSAPHRGVRYVACLWPVAVLLGTMATAQGFLFDCLAGALVAFLGWRVNGFVTVFTPLQDLVFCLLRVRCPDAGWGRGMAGGDGVLGQTKRFGRCLD